jgi:protein gp37
MSNNSKIEWTHHTFNPWVGCTKVSPACKNCYAEKRVTQLRFAEWGDAAVRRITSNDNWQEPLKWNRKAQRLGVRHRVFCASWADVFEDRRDLDAPRARLWDLIAATPHLDWLLLTKRIDRVRDLVPWGDSWPHNVWLGTTVEDRRRAVERIPHLLSLPAVVRFLSVEPLLEAIDLSPWLDGPARLDWVIAGGESGSGARCYDPEWFRLLRDQCFGAGIPFFFKQWGTLGPSPSGALIHLGKRASGRELDGRTWDEVPTPRTTEGAPANLVGSASEPAQGPLEAVNPSTERGPTAHADQVASHDMKALLTAIASVKGSSVCEHVRDLVAAVLAGQVDGDDVLALLGP